MRTLVTLDPETGAFDEPRGASSNVANFYNFWQHRGSLHDPADSEMELIQNGVSLGFEDQATELGAVLRGDELDSAATNTVQVQIELHRRYDFVQHRYDADPLATPGLDGRMPGANVNHDTVPWYAFDESVAALRS